MRVYANYVRPLRDDAALVRGAQAGEVGSFEAIFKRHHAPLLSYCRHMLCSRDEGEDALQQAFIKAHQALLGGTEPRELRPWLYAIARNCCLSAIAARRPTTPLADHTPALAGLSEEVHQREDLRELLAAIGRLPEDQRSALLLAELDDLSHQAIATIVGCPVSRVKALVYQARSALIADRDALGTSCRDIREELAVARGGELRRGPLRRHLKLCAGCRDFQLALSAQRQSLAAVLPVLPSAGLAAAILGHGAAHAAGAASVGGAGLAPAGGAGAGATATGGTGIGATATGGTGIAAGGTAAASTATGVGAGAGVGGGTGIGALVGGGLVTKLAVGGTVVALATAGAVTVHNRQAHPTSHGTARPPAFAGTAGRRSVATDIASASGPSGSLGPGSAPALALASATAPAGSTGAGPPAELSGPGGAAPLLTATGALPPRVGGNPIPPGVPGQPAGKAGLSVGGKAGRSKSGVGGDPAARAKHRAALRRQHAALRRRLGRARIRRHRRRAARRRAHLRKALHHRRAVKPQPPELPVAPVPIRAPHRKARLTPTSGTVGAPASGPTTGGARHGASGPHHHPSTGTGTGTTSTGEGTGTGTGTGTTGTGAGKTGSGKAGGAGSGKAGPGGGKAGGSKNTETTGNNSVSTSGTPSASEPSGAATGTSDTTGTGTTIGPSRKTGSRTTPKKHLVEEEQLPNL